VEVEALSRGESLEDVAQIGPGADQRFIYRVVPAAAGLEGKLMFARLDGLALNVAVSAEALKQWHESPELALAADQGSPGSTLKLLLEKDLQRLNPKPGEDSSSSYPNPLFGKVRCDHP